MNVASKELSQELYELSGWSDVTAYYNENTDDDEDGNPHYEIHVDGTRFADLDNPTGDYLSTPAYSLDFLMRKLPRHVNRGRLSLIAANSNQWSASYDLGAYEEHITYGGTPENAACKLAIELFKQRILKRD